MKAYIQNLKKHIQENKITFEQESSQACLDALWWNYSGSHNLDNDEILEKYKALRARLNELSAQDSDELISEIACLCAEYERVAFTAGMRLGAQLMLEIQDD